MSWFWQNLITAALVGGAAAVAWMLSRRQYWRLACREIAARQARGYGVLYEVKPFWKDCYFLYTQTVNRTYLYDQLAYGEMTTAEC